MKYSIRFLAIGVLAWSLSTLPADTACAQNPFENFQKKVDEALPKGRLLKKLRDDLTGKTDEDRKQEKQQEKQQEKLREEAKRNNANGNRREPTPAPVPPGFTPPGNRSATPGFNSRGPQNANDSLLNSNFVPPQVGGNIPRTSGPDTAANNDAAAAFRFSQPAGKPIDNAAGFGLELEETNDGLIVRSITPGGNAAEAGLKRGDRITQIGGVPVATQAEWNEIAQILSPGDQIQVEWARNGKKGEADLGYGSAADRGNDTREGDVNPPLANASSSTAPAIDPPLSGSLDTREQLGDTPINDFLPPPANTPSRNSQSVLRAAPEANRNILAPPAGQNATATQQELNYLRQTVEQQNQMIRELQQEVQRLRAQGASSQRNSRGR